MDKFDRIYALHGIFSTRHYPVSLATLSHELECASSSAKRLIGQMKDFYGAPIKNRRGVGYYYDRSVAFELPGIWFNMQELEALLVMQTMLSDIGDGLLTEQFEALRGHVEKSLAHIAPAAMDELVRIRIPAFGRRGRKPACFPLLISVLLERKRLQIDYNSRSSDEMSTRVISPQRLLHYKNNWYTDAWCHEANDLRTFAVENIRAARRLDQPAYELAAEELDRRLIRSYGIFGGEATQTAVLRFSARAARWAADEEWFPDQQGQWLQDGRYELSVPYGNPTELIMDICRYGPDVEVVAPETLHSAVADALNHAADQYA